MNKENIQFEKNRRLTQIKAVPNQIGKQGILKRKRK